MKKQINTLCIVAALLVAGAATTSSCTKEAESAPAGGTYTMTVEATKGPASKQLTEAADGSISASWAEGENVYVMKGSDWADGTLNPLQAGATATLQGSLSGVTINAGDELTLQFPKSGTPSYLDQQGTLADIAANFDYAKATVTVSSVDANGNITASAANFENKQAIIKFTLRDGTGNNPVNPVMLHISDGTHEASVRNLDNTSNVVYVAFPAASAAKTITLIAYTLTAGNTVTKYTKTQPGVTLTNGQFYNIEVRMAEAVAPTAPDDAINGLFSVSSDQIAFFAKGNLQAVFPGSDENANTEDAHNWQFATHQWDFAGNGTTGNGNVSPSANTHIDGDNSVSQAGTVDLFNWVGNEATTHQDFGINKESARRKLKGTFLKSDWGVAIAADTWKTPTQDDWNYVCNKRTTLTGIRYAKAKVAGVDGVILLPDNWLEAYHPLASTNNASADYTANVISETEWTSLEAHGAVFLPCAGNLTSQLSWSTDTYYQSSTSDGGTDAYALNLSDMSSGTSYSLINHFAVRLINKPGNN